MRMGKVAAEWAESWALVSEIALELGLGRDCGDSANQGRGFDLPIKKVSSRRR